MNILSTPRARVIQEATYAGGPIVYWMNRDQRVHDNWALLAALEWARQEHVPLLVAHNLVGGFLGGGERQWAFKTTGLKEVAETLEEKHIPFFLFEGDGAHTAMAKWVQKEGIGGVVTDFYPLRLPRTWLKDITKALPKTPIYQVDAHNIVPCWVASAKQEFAARTIRPKIHAALKTWLTDIPTFHAQTTSSIPKAPKIDWKKLIISRTNEQLLSEIPTPGEQAAKHALNEFIEERLPGYATRRNDPCADGQSRLSPYLHYGHLSAQRVAYEVQRAHAPLADKEAFLEELIVRRELADNFCHYNEAYDGFEGFPAWAQATLNTHRDDTREHVYTHKQFEHAQTHDELWNAAQRQLTQTGTMHGYVRMYWAKQILAWSKSPEDALKIAIALNDAYQLDGRDPNGYVGVAWSIGGVHDRRWFNRAVFGTVRAMTRGGMDKKFDTKAYIERWAT